ncbi:MAG: hypothetical protein VW835_19085, partial [Rickettsiales bacterium]
MLADKKSAEAQDVEGLVNRNGVDLFDRAPDPGTGVIDDQIRLVDIRRHILEKRLDRRRVARVAGVGFRIGLRRQTTQ